MLTPLDEAVVRAFQLLSHNKIEEARAELTRLSEASRAESNHTAAAESAPGLARIATREGRTGDAKTLLLRAPSSLAATSR
jgi:hypothetical protein